MSSIEVEVRVRYRRGFAEQEVIERVFIRCEHPPQTGDLVHLAQVAACHAADAAACRGG